MTVLNIHKLQQNAVCNPSRTVVTLGTLMKDQIRKEMMVASNDGSAGCILLRAVIHD